VKYIVKEDAQLYAEDAINSLLAIESPDWFAWLDKAAQFTFQCPAGAFSARKERIAHGRGGFYWRAYRKKQGKLCRVYLGKNEQVTMGRLHAVALELARRLEGGNGTRAAQPAQPLCVASRTSDEIQQTARADVTHQLLHTKFRRPPLQTGLVERDRLIERLNRGTRQRLVVLSAAAGAGKTTLLGEWACQSSARVAWVTLDAADNDPVRFWSYIVAALHDASLASAASLLEMLHALPSQSFQPVLNELLNSLDDEKHEVVIILDDYHLIDIQAIHDSLVYFLNHLPPHVHLVLSSRYALPFPVAQLRARNQLVELQFADLAFTHAEVGCFFAQTAQIALNSSDVETLAEQTEGWIAGLQLLALAWPARQDTTQLLSIKGSQHFLFQYLIEEVLEQQPERVRQFLLTTSVLERFTAELCDMLTGEESGAALLAYLAQKNLFLCALDSEGRWYRYHYLLAKALRSRLHQLQPEYCSELHGRASAWFERHDLLEEALEHAWASPDQTRAGDLLERLVEQMLRQHEFASITRWQKLLSAEALAERPWLQLSWARACMASGHLEQAAETLRVLERSGLEKVATDAVDTFRGRLAALRAHLHSLRGEAEQALNCAAQALALLAEDEQEQRVDMQATMGGAYLHAGKLIEAEQLFRHVVAARLQMQQPYHALDALYSLGQTRILSGQPLQANAAYMQGIQLASRSGFTRSAMAGYMHIGRGHLLYEWNDLTGAQEHLMTGLELTRRGENTLQALDATLALADVRQAQGRTQDAFTLLGQAQALARRTSDPFFLDFVAHYSVFLWLAAHEVEKATCCARDTGLSAYGEVDDIATLPSTFFLLLDLLLLVQLHLAQGRYSSANRLLAQLQAPLMNGPHKRRRIQWLILHALALDAEKHNPTAIAALAQALELAEPLGYIRTFVDMGTDLLPLLKTLYHLKPLTNYSRHYIQQLLTALGAQEIAAFYKENEARAELLGEREWMVLCCLEEGCSDREVARRLVLTENTVRTHTKHIYRKLDAHSRTQALARARERGLL
jgi:LuxR family maltose regulon positive regulatory protein